MSKGYGAVCGFEKSTCDTFFFFLKQKSTSKGFIKCLDFWSSVGHWQILGWGIDKFKSSTPYLKFLAVLLFTEYHTVNVGTRLQCFDLATILFD